MAILSASVFALMASFARASHYEVTYSGGAASYAPTSPSPPYQVPYSLTGTNNSWGGGGNPAKEGGTGKPTPGSVTCSGSIVATLTWKLDPGERTLAPTPSLILVAETVNLTASGDSWNLEDGFGDNATAPGAGSLTHTGYAVVSNPGQTVILGGVTPFGQAQASVMSPSCTVNYFDTVIIPSLNLTGTTSFQGDLSPHLLVGQQLTAVAGVGVSADAGTSPQYSWSSTGGHPFSGYQYGQTGKVLPWIEKSSTAHPYFSGETSFVLHDPITIKCLVDMTAGGQALSIPLSATFTLDSPTSQMDPVATGTVQIAGATDALRLILTGLTQGAYGNGNCGIYFPSTATTPAGFGGDGDFCFAQVIDPVRVETINGQQETVPGDGEWGLDNAFPYNYEPQQTYPANGQVINGQDEPWISLSDPFETAASASDQAEMFLMYRPPGSNACWVPLRQVPWSWSGSATLSGLNWTLSNYSVSPNPASISTCFHPTWTLVHTNNN